MSSYHIVLALVLPAAYVLGLCIYRLYFHPLAKYPGPFLAKISSLHGTYHGWKGDLGWDIYQCHKKYGDKVRYSPNFLLFNSASGHYDIYAHQANVVKTKHYKELAHRSPSILTITNKAQHSIRRRLVAQCLSEQKILGHEEAILNSVKALCDKLLEPSTSTTRNMSKWSDFLFFDIMSKVAFGLSFNLLKENKYRHLPDAIQESNRRISVLVWNTAFRLFKFDEWAFPKAISGKKHFISFIQEVVMKAYMEKPGSNASVFSNLRTAKDPETGTQLNMTQLSAECAVLIVAGSDTSSTALVSTLFYLTRYPEAYQKVIAEVRAAFKTPEDVHFGPALSGCKYLRACINEAMRLSPPVGSALWREVSPGGIVVDGTQVPSGMVIGTGIYALHHNEEYYPDPFTFKPERWTQGNADSGKAIGASGAPTSSAPTLAPFGIGPRSCVGRGLAIAEMMISMAYIFSKMDMASSGNHTTYSGKDIVNERVEGQTEFEMREWITSAKSDLVLNFKPREITA